MEKTWRWFGKKDPITLDMLRQIGVEGICAKLLQRAVENDTADIGSQRVGGLRRNTVPCAKIGVVHTFFRVLMIVQNASGDFHAQVAVFLGQFGDGLL